MYLKIKNVLSLSCAITKFNDCVLILIPVARLCYHALGMCVLNMLAIHVDVPLLCLLAVNICVRFSI